jgi:hypothetical protein
MRSLFTIVAAVFVTAISWAQIPQKMSYQAVIRNSENALVTSSPVGMRISILQGSTDGSPVYVENQTPTSNANGLATIEIGGGTPVTGTFASIDWSSGLYFIKTETDPTGGTNYTITGTSQMLSVPYALYAEISGSTNGHYVGEAYGGGVVFWVDQTGQHGLVCSMIDLSEGFEWSNVASSLIGSTAQSYWDGLSNSNAIVGQEGHTSSAAKLCFDYTNIDYSTGIYNDWYLPSRGELTQLFNNIFPVHKTLESDGNIATTLLVGDFTYWSSTEYDATDAFQCDQFFSAGNGKPLTFSRVRAVRTF